MDQPASVGDYQVIRTINQGLMGSVYHVTSDNQYWALRVLKTDSTRQTKGIRALVGDQRHPSLVRYKEVGMDASAGAFLVTDYIESQSITRDSMAGLTTPAHDIFMRS